jgi:subtilase family serine protease
MRLIYVIFLVVILAFSSKVAVATPSVGAPLQTQQNQFHPVLPVTLSGYRRVGEPPFSYTVYVTVAIPLRNLSVLQYIVKETSDPHSTMFHHFLTLNQVQNMFLPKQQFKSILTYLSSHGFKIDLTAMDSMIVAQASALQVDEYLGLKIGVYSNGIDQYYSAYGTPTLPNVYIYSSNVTSLLFAHPDTLVTQKAAANLFQSESQPNTTFAIEGYSAKALQSAYNSTALLSRGIDGSGYTIGILDFFGDPTIVGQLQAFDKEFGFQAPPSFNVTSIGQYNPNLGVFTGWSGEISLDVEMAHAMAPGANLLLYAANGALPLAAIIAFVDQQDKVNVLSQSFTVPESIFASIGPLALEFNVILTDQYYLLGSAEGITFTASTGDTGGSGFSAGPEGTPGYPSTSPYVTAVGGTTTYFVFGSGGAVESSYQTAWSNYGFIPFETNYGGSTGGVSIAEPKPWYQQPLASPPGYPNGRLVPDIALNANVFPGVFVVLPGNTTAISGGTSESSPLFAGLLTLVMQYVHSSLGLVNPELWSLGLNGSLYSKAYQPITFGYNIPWTTYRGYTLVTGWGAPNIGEIATLFKASYGRELNVSVSAVNQSFYPSSEFTAGQKILVAANVTLNGSPVTTGVFRATLETLQGNIANTSLSYSSAAKLWLGEIVVPKRAQGISYVNVAGNTEGIQGEGFTDVFTGYVMTAESPSSVLPWSTQFGVPIVVTIAKLNGESVNNGTFSLTAFSYSINTNEYSSVSTVELVRTASVAGNVSTGQGTVWYGVLQGSYPQGPMTLVGNGAYCYLPFMNGVDLQQSFILPQVLVEPGSVAPGQAISIEAQLIAPLNLPFAVSAQTGLPVGVDVELGSNVTATLVGPSGIKVETVNLVANVVGLTSIFQGSLQVPLNSQPGLYTVMLNSVYESYSLNTTINGTFFGQIWVAPSYSLPKIYTTTSAAGSVQAGPNSANVSVSRDAGQPSAQSFSFLSGSPAFEGQTLFIYSNITYSNGTEVKYGMYSAAVYSRDVEDAYSQITVTSTVPLFYDAQLGLWVGNVTLPSPYNPVSATSVFSGPQGINGAYDVFVSGISWDAVPTTTRLSAQHGFFIQPLVYMANQTLSSPSQTSGLALFNDNINGSNSFEGDEFFGNNYLSGNIVVASSQVNGTLYFNNSSATLIDVNGGDIVANNSRLTFEDSHVKEIVLSGSTVNLTSSTYGSVTPQLPNITVLRPRPSTAYTGVVNVSVRVSGASISQVKVYLSGQLVKLFTGGGELNFQLNTRSYPDGTYTLTVQAVQTDGLSSTVQVPFSIQNQLSNQATQQFFESSAALAVAVIGVVLAVVALRRNGRSTPKQPL